MASLEAVFCATMFLLLAPHVHMASTTLHLSSLLREQCERYAAGDRPSYDYCVWKLGRDRASATAGARGLAAIAARAARATAKATAARIAGLQATETVPARRDPLAACAAEYAAAVRRLCLLYTSHRVCGPPMLYDAWVIYNFFSLCLAWVGGPGTVVVSLNGQSLKPSWFMMTCCLPAIPLDGRFIRRCKQGCLQFVILKPILVVITFILYAQGKYEDGNFSVDQSYLYITIIYTISYSMALFALALFYAACRDLLQPYNPVPKFIIIKSVVFLTYWQGVLVFLAAKSGFIKNAEKAAYLQNFVLCVEMLIAAIGHRFAFSYKEYAGSNARPFGGFRGSLLHAMKFNDFYHDTVHQFAPTYHEYVLYSNKEEDEPTKYSPSTIVPTGEHIVELAEVTVVGSKAPAVSSLLLNEANQADTMPTQSMEVKTATSAEPYELPNFLNVELSDNPAEVPMVPDVRQ